jgi:hypothetical protein
MDGELEGETPYTYTSKAPAGSAKRVFGDGDGGKSGDEEKKKGR